MLSVNRGRRAATKFQHLNLSEFVRAKWRDDNYPIFSKYVLIKRWTYWVSDKDRLLVSLQTGILLLLLLGVPISHSWLFWGRRPMVRGSITGRGHDRALKSLSHGRCHCWRRRIASACGRKAGEADWWLAATRRRASNTGLVSVRTNGQVIWPWTMPAKMKK